MRKIIQAIKEQFKSFTSFNYAERRGIVVLIMLILIVEAGNAYLPAIHEYDKTDLSAFEEELRLFEEALSQPDTLEKVKKKKFTYTKTSSVYPNRFNKSGTAAAKPPMIVEINTADTAKLVRLYGIGPVFADRILKYRGLLGGFYASEQLLEVYGMDSVRYDQMRAYISIDTSAIDRIPVNKAEFKHLLRHPYLDYETVKQIVNYIKYTGPILNADTLRKVIAYDPVFEKVKHYINY
ncbi:MAG: helix-hairpin-helix domain-containing protein [Bacteroidales bacterium]|nr:helix-hairpin-helix domain-containing protein [Bacteroidales bacterium]